MVSSSTSIPFSALVGLSEAKLALILAIIDPKIGGVLISGPKGTGKSTLVRSLYSILPDIEFIKSCPFHCVPRDMKNMCENCQNTHQTDESRNGRIRAQRCESHLVDRNFHYRYWFRQRTEACESAPMTNVD